MQWTILIESAPDNFTPTGEVFTGDMEQVQAHLADLQAQTGHCYAAQAVEAANG